MLNNKGFFIGVIYVFRLLCMNFNGSFTTNRDRKRISVRFLKPLLL
ncbi:hypothetical protein VCRA217O167_280006 [Vibrio crassostreae]|nr:hypothetical protein VCRA2113O137_90129 [Vibrio crassostreae]CAK2686791.1 hypothetical protein VCRA2113O116_170057 [Vibrio crassostreae]CAK2846488.1 hypothetical protein VCRA217O167_280006 [Vibrio crassostreae]CAK2882168.1 hypothetical protein VCRA2113O139_20283 [Vibrio crassostreae]CAK3368188.1 hypothetical protein VCRA2123O283_280006 [Vibrio crassostreae]